MADDIDMSLLMPMDNEAVRGQDDIVCQILDGRYTLLPEQLARLQVLIDSQCQAPEDKDVVTISEDDLLSIVNTSGSVTDTDINEILNTNTVPAPQESNHIVTDFLSDPTTTTVCVTDFQEYPSSPYATTSILLPQASNQSASPGPAAAGNKTISSAMLGHGRTLPVQPSLAQVGGNPKVGIPLTITLPPDLPAGRYLMKHSVTDPSMVELSFPDSPNLKPLLIPVGPRNTAPVNPGRGVRMRGAARLINQGRGPRTRGATPQTAILRPNQPCTFSFQGPRSVTVMPKMTATSATSYQPQKPMTGILVRQISTPNTTSINASVRMVPAAKSPPVSYRSLLPDNPSMASQFTSTSFTTALASQSAPVFSTPISQTLTNTSQLSSFQLPLPMMSASHAVSITSASTADGLRLGAPVQLSTGSSEPIRTPIKVGNVTYLPVGFPIQVSESLKPGVAMSMPMVNVSTVSGGLAMTGINTAIQIDSASKTQLPVMQLKKLAKSKTQLIKQVQLIDTADGLKTKEVISISPVVSDVRPLVSTRKPPAKMIKVNSDQLKCSEDVTISSPKGLKPAAVNAPVSLMSKGVINHKGELILTKVVTMASKVTQLKSQSGIDVSASSLSASSLSLSSASSLSVSSALSSAPSGQQVESTALAPLSGLLNFALGKAQLSAPVPSTQNLTHYTKPPPKPRKIFGRSTEALMSLNQPIQAQRTIKATSGAHFPASNSIENQPYGSKYIIDNGLIGVQTVDVSEQALALTSMRMREQSHKMVSVTIRDNCINFKNEAGAMAELLLKHSMMKTASERSRKDILDDITNLVVEKTEKQTDGAQAVASPVARTQPVSVRQNDGVNDGIPMCQGKSKEKLQEMEAQIEANAMPDEVLAMKEQEFEVERLKSYYRRLMLEQNKKEEQLTSKLDSLLMTSVTRERALSRLFQGVPLFVDDPLTGDSNAPMYFCCYLCSFASFNEAKVCVHWTLVHLKQNPYMCGYCAARFNSSGKAHRHLLLAHPAQKILIKMTPSELFANPVQFEFIQEEEDNSDTLCPMIEVGPKDCLRKHQRLFACKECVFTAPREGAMMQHVRKAHLSLCPYSCGDCGQEFASSALCEAHLRKAHPALETQVTEDSQLRMMQERLRLSDFYSVIPRNRPVMFEPNCEYWRHEENKLDRQKKRFSCTLCTFFTKQLEVVWKHVRQEHHLPEGVYCKRCSCYHRLSDIEREKEFFVCYSCCTLSSLRLDKVCPCVHLRQVFLCLKCREQMEDLNSMKKHIKSRHIDVYPYSCVSCRAKFVMKQAAVNHAIETHGTESVIKKQSLLLARMAKRVRKLHIKYMYVEPHDEDGELSVLWETHGLKIVRAGEERFENEMNVGSNLPDELEEVNEQDDEADVAIVTSMDPSHRPATVIDADSREFAGSHHYRCRLCLYKCLDRSCMARHVKYMHLRMHPHSCPFCGYSNVEKTKVKIHISNLHNKSQKKVRTNTTLVTALGEESKKHFVRVFPNGHEISQVDTGLSRVEIGKSGRGMEQLDPATEEPEAVSEGSFINDPAIKLEPVVGEELLVEPVDDQQLELLDKELEALQWQGLTVKVKEEPGFGDHEVVDLDSCEEVQDAGSPSATSILYNMLTGPRVAGVARVAGAQGPPGGEGHKRRAPQPLEAPAKRRRPTNHIYPSRASIMADHKLRLLPIVILQDVLRHVLVDY